TRMMLQALVSTASHLLQDLQRSLSRPRPGRHPAAHGQAPAGITYGPLQRVLLTDGVGRTLFEEYAGHRAQARGEEETGGDLRGGGRWVRHLRGLEGVFGIGTADGPEGPGTLFAYQPRPHVQCLGALRFSWYALRHGETTYRALPVGLTIGPDLARPLHDI